MFNIAEYRTKNKPFSDHIPWAALIKEGVVLNKDGSFQKTYKFRGPDMDSATGSELVFARSKFNHFISSLGTSWCIHIEARCKKSVQYYKSDFPFPAAELFERERHFSFSADQGQYESDYFLTLTYLPPPEIKGKLGEAIYTSDDVEKKSDKNYREELEYFEATCGKITDGLRSLMSSCRALNDNETLTYLHDCVSNSHVEIERPDIPFGLDYLLTDESLLSGVKPKLGDQYLGIITVKKYPGKTIPVLLRELDQLKIEYRWVSRYIPFDRHEAEKKLKALRRNWFSKRKSLWSIMGEVFTGHQSVLEDTDAIKKAADVNAILEAIGNGSMILGEFTPVIILKDKDPEILSQKIKAVEECVQRAGFHTLVETLNAVDSYLSSLPGHAYANVKRRLVPSLNFFDMIPYSASWAGPEWNKHLNGPPLMFTKCEGNKQFRLNLHRGDLGMGLVVGPPGAGKSLLLSCLALQFLKYPNAQVYFFDKGRSSRATTLSVGGSFFDLGNFSDDGTTIALQPLAGIDDPKERAWASEWLIGILESEIAITPRIKTEIWDALSNVAMQPVESRTLTVFSAIVQSHEIKEALSPFVHGGALGDLLDSNSETIEYARWQAFEMKDLMGMKSAVMPVLSYLFHKLEKRFTGVPTLLILDEAWLFLDYPQFREKIKEWLKTLRKNNVSVVFATQQLSDVIKSEIANVIIETCETRIFLPNENAEAPEVVPFYKSMGLNNKQISIIKYAQKKHDYYFQSPDGARKFNLDMGTLGLALTGSSSDEDHILMDNILRTNPDNFLGEFLGAKGVEIDQELVDDINQTVSNLQEAS